jgi:hypothetical protein
VLTLVKCAVVRLCSLVARHSARLISNRPIDCHFALQKRSGSLSSTSGSHDSRTPSQREADEAERIRKELPWYRGVTLKDVKEWKTVAPDGIKDDKCGNVQKYLLIEAGYYYISRTTEDTGIA